FAVPFEALGHDPGETVEMVAVAHENGKPVEQLPPTGSIPVRVPGDVLRGRQNQPLRILIVAAEVAPFAKVGGLADVAGALPKALHAMGHDVRLAMPSYPMVENNPAYGVHTLIPCLDVPINPGWTEPASILQTQIDDVPVYMVRSDNFFRDATESRRVYSMEPEPYIFFNRAVAEMVPHLEPAWSPDVLHCNDWHTGL